jgi:hypothetical protein
MRQLELVSTCTTLEGADPILQVPRGHHTNQRPGKGHGKCESTVTTQFCIWLLRRSPARVFAHVASHYAPLIKGTINRAGDQANPRLPEHHFGSVK